MHELWNHAGFETFFHLLYENQAHFLPKNHSTNGNFSSFVKLAVHEIDFQNSLYNLKLNKTFTFLKRNSNKKI